MLRTSDLLDAIAGGEFDNDIRKILRACYDRQHLLEKAAYWHRVSQWQIGDRVRIDDYSVRPKYMIGEIGVILEMPIIDGEPGVKIRMVNGAIRAMSDIQEFRCQQVTHLG